MFPLVLPACLSQIYSTVSRPTLRLSLLSLNQFSFSRGCSLYLWPATCLFLTVVEFDCPTEQRASGTRRLMHAFELAQLATTIESLAGPHYWMRVSMPAMAGKAYWLVSRYRHEEWMHRLAVHRDQLPRVGSSRRLQSWQAIYPTLQEILLAEPLVRVVACHAATLERLELDQDLSPLASSVLAAHIEARNRCLHLVVFGQGMPVEDAVRLNRLRRGVEGYVDQLLAGFPATSRAQEYCFSEEHLERCQRELLVLRSHAGLWRLRSFAAMARLSSDVLADVDWRAANPRLNHQLSEQALELIQPQVFSALGTPYSLRLAQYAQPSPESAPGGMRAADELASSILPAKSLRNRPRFHPRPLSGES